MDPSSILVLIASETVFVIVDGDEYRNSAAYARAAYFILDDEKIREFLLGGKWCWNWNWIKNLRKLELPSVKVWNVKTVRCILGLSSYEN